MNLVTFRTCLAVLAGLALAATGAWAAGEEEQPAAAMEKEMVLDPTTGEMVTAPEYGGTITFVVKLEPPSADPLFGSGASRGPDGVTEKLGIVNWGIDREVYDLTGAFFYFRLSVLTGRLAESWETPDATTAIFNIRRGVHWHDKAPMNGRELTAGDVEFNFHRMSGSGSGFTEPPGGYAAIFATLPFASIEATDDHTVVMTLSEPRLGWVSSVLVDWAAHVMPPEVIREHGDVKDWRNLVGTGPFMMTDWVDGSSQTWVRSPDYWGFDEKFPENRLPYFDEVNGLIMKEDATILAALRSGTLDYVGLTGAGEMIYTAQKESLEKSNPDMLFYPYAARSENAMTYNMGDDQPYATDVRVRRALQMALDLETMHETYFRGASFWVPQGTVGVAIGGVPFDQWPEEVRKGYMYDPEGAEALLDEAGLPRGADGTRFEIPLQHYEFFDVDYAQLAVAYWKEIGVDVQIDVTERSEHMARIRERGFEGMVSAISAISYLSPLVAIGSNYSQSAWNPPGLDDPEFDRLYEAARDAATEEEQIRMANLADMWLTENHIRVWGPTAPKFNAVQPWLKGYNGESMLGGDDRLVLFSRLWFDHALMEEMGQ